MHEYLSHGVTFSDYAFEKITDSQVRAMWHWFCTPYPPRKDPVKVLDRKILDSNDSIVHAKYRVNYLYGKGGREVDYYIAAKFTLKDGKIVKQEDRFDSISKREFSKMAFGNPFFPRFLLRIAAKRKLKKFMNDNAY